LKFIGESFRR